MSSKYHGTNATHAIWITPASPTPPSRRATGAVRGRAPLLTDAQILEMRALSEFAEWGTKRLQLRFRVDAEAVRRILLGITRSKLVASRKHLPKDLEAA